MATTEPDPERAPRLLLTERNALIPLLQGFSADQFELSTVLPGWSVRDVLAHCSAALGRAATNRMNGFTPAENQVDVDERRPWPIGDLIAELGQNYAGAAQAVRAADGRLDGLALGEWIHGGDVRDAVGHPDAWSSAGIDDALALLVLRSRDASQNVPATAVDLDGAGHLLGPTGAEPTARLTADRATLMRICAGRSPDPAAYQLEGAQPEDLLVFH